MRWSDVLFAHWPVPVEALRPLVPAPLAIDTFDGWAWLGVVPFRMSGVRPRLAPPFLGLAFPELNVRTYVRSRGASGVWFFSLDATSRLAVIGARRAYGLNYYRADMACLRQDDGVQYVHRRTHPGAPPAAFEATYRPTGPVSEAPAGSLDHFLTERYALYSLDRQGRLRIGDIHHQPWPLQPATASIRINTMADQLGITLPSREPILHFARDLEVVFWHLRRLREDGR